MAKAEVKVQLHESVPAIWNAMRTLVNSIAACDPEDLPPEVLAAARDVAAAIDEWYTTPKE